MSNVLDRLAVALATRRALVGSLLVVLTLALGAGLLRLEFETSQDTLVDPGSQVAEDNRSFQDRFGGDAMLVAWTGDIADVTAGGNLERLRTIEEELRGTGRFDAVIGPVTALEFAEAQLAIAPELLGRNGKVDVLVEEAGRLAAAGEASLDNPDFVDFLIHEGDGSIRAAMQDNFPDEQTLLMLVRLEGNVDIAAQGEAAGEVQDVIDEHPLEGFEHVAAGTPTLLAEINDYLQGGMAALGAFAVAAMVLLLALVFRARWRLLSLLVVVVGCTWAFGLAGWLGIPLTLVTISGLPILLGLGVDFAIQLHSRFEEELRKGATATDATRASLVGMGPPLLIAMVAAVAGLLALELSRVPMIRDFGILLALGMVTLVVAAVVLVPFVLCGRELRMPTALPAGARPDGRLEHLVRRLVTLVRRGTAPIVVLAVVLAGLGIWVERRTEIETDPERWIAQDSGAVRDLEALRDATGFSSEVDVLVEADDVNAPEVVEWMQAYAQRQLDAHPDALLRVTSLPGITANVLGSEAAAEDVADVLEVAPEEVRRSFVSDDGRAAALVFPVAPISLEERDRLLDDMVADLDPPDGVRATPAGLAVVGVELVDSLQVAQGWITLASLAFVLLWLLVAYRRWKLALLPLVPVLLAVGLSSLVIHLLGIALTPLTTVAGPLAIAIATEFSVLVQARYLEERGRGLAPEDAVREGGTRIGRAFLASGLTVLGGFVVLVLAPMPLLVDFGIVVSVIVLIALLCCLVVMPPLLVRTDPAAR